MAAGMPVPGSGEGAGSRAGTGVPGPRVPAFWTGREPGRRWPGGSGGKAVAGVAGGLAAGGWSRVAARVPGRERGSGAPGAPGPVFRAGRELGRRWPGVSGGKAVAGVAGGLATGEWSRVAARVPGRERGSGAPGAPGPVFRAGREPGRRWPDVRAARPWRAWQEDWPPGCGPGRPRGRRVASRIGGGRTSRAARPWPAWREDWPPGCGPGQPRGRRVASRIGGGRTSRAARPWPAWREDWPPGGWAAARVPGRERGSGAPGPPGPVFRAGWGAGRRWPDVPGRKAVAGATGGPVRTVDRRSPRLASARSGGAGRLRTGW